MPKHTWFKVILITFLVLPMVRECCLPTVVVRACHHQSKHADNEWCSENQEAIAENRSTLCFSPLHLGFTATDVKEAVHVETNGEAADELLLARTHTVDLYLRTGALLI